MIKASQGAANNECNACLAEYLGIRRIWCRDDTMGELGLDIVKTIPRLINEGFILPRLRWIEIRRRFHGKQIIWEKGGKRYGCNLKPIIREVRIRTRCELRAEDWVLDNVAMAERLKQIIKEAMPK